jgi:hypothetical protein
VAVGPAPVGTRGAVGRRLILAALGASFVGGQARGLRALLHGDLIVQPPEPDSARRGAAAADYLDRLARESALTRSQLLPTSISREGASCWSGAAGTPGLRGAHVCQPPSDPLAGVTVRLAGGVVAVDAVPIAL